MKNSLTPNPELPTSYAGFPSSRLFSPVSEPCSVFLEPCSHSSFSDFSFPFSDSFGFNGQEKDDEIYGEGSALSFEFRMYDSRLGRWFSIDPLQAKYPNLSPYAFTANNPIRFVDIGGKDFGVIINHTDETIVIVANIQTTSAKAYRQVTEAAKVWNNKTTTTDDGYTVNFQIKIMEPITATTEEVISGFGNVNFYKENGKMNNKLVSEYRRKLINGKAITAAWEDPIGNSYSGNTGNNSKNVSGNDFVGGQTQNFKFADMNTHDLMWDMGEYPRAVAHELGHFFGLGDKGQSYYPGDGGIMQYTWPMNNVNDNDVKMILKYVEDYLNGDVAGGIKARVTVTEISEKKGDRE
ncbi:hypothetical protein LJC68_08490 [Bacteroidales bacterium OttesenSCG-928-B11]|nr:hypothetical protein [Bacteroidales bacterium OttesenSCG-928-C03]MDL2312897.1 hypothetical protein [Bacteroidales bacterium OttesenSCG-928-B11]MDL2326381.1 hypothetical protein [Bacteroidales bacterium OttesenSCG-928-A14]